MRERNAIYYIRLNTRSILIWLDSILPNYWAIVGDCLNYPVTLSAVMITSQGLIVYLFAK